MTELYLKLRHFLVLNLLRCYEFIETENLQATELGWAMLMSLFHCYPTRSKHGRAISILYHVNFRVRNASEVQERFRRQRKSWWNHIHLMNYSVAVLNRHTEGPVTKWTIERTPNVNAALLARAKSPARMTQEKKVWTVSLTKFFKLCKILNFAKV